MQDPAGAFGETFSGFSNWTKCLGPVDYPALIADLHADTAVAEHTLK